MGFASISIVYQDFKQRAITWWLPVLILAASLSLSGTSIGIQQTLSFWSVNSLFLVLQLGMVAVLFGLVKKQLAFFDELIGLGDVVYLFSLAALFSTVNFLIFYCISLVLSLVGFLVYRLLAKKTETTIPLAGTLSICLILFVSIVKFLGYDPWDELPIYLWLS